jgi:membrane protein required for colicin V production
MVSYIDILIVIILLLAIWRGWKNGFVMELFSMLAIFVGIYAGIHLSDWFTVFMRDKMDTTTPYMPIISFVSVMILVIIGIYLLGKLLTKTLKAGGAETWNQIGGAFFSLSKTILTLSVLFIVFHSFDQKTGLIPQDQKDKSIFYSPIYKFSMVVLPSMKESELYKRITQVDIESSIEK